MQKMTRLGGARCNTKGADIPPHLVSGCFCADAGRGQPRVCWRPRFGLDPKRIRGKLCITVSSRCGKSKKDGLSYVPICRLWNAGVPGTAVDSAVLANWGRFTQFVTHAAAAHLYTAATAVGR